MEVLTKTVNIEIRPTPEDLARIWCDMIEDDQAQFFNYIAEFSKQWHSSLCFQLQHITDSEELNDKGRDVMRQIGEYSKKS